MRRHINVPSNLSETVMEDCDPTSMLDDLVSSDLPEMLNFILDFKGDDQTFVDELKERAARICNRWIDELGDYFEEGFTHVIPFLRENFKAILTASCEPNKAKLVVSLGIDPIMAFVTTSGKHEERTMRKVAEPSLQAEQRQEQVEEKKGEDEEMTDDADTLGLALAKCATTEAKREMLLKKYRQTLQVS
jgi:hypothetical protein